MKLSKILDARPATAFPEEPAGVVWERMREGNADHAVVLDKSGVVGVLSRHDLSGPSGGTHRRMGRRVADLMRRDVVTATPSTSVRVAAKRMRVHGVGCLPVMERGRLVGIVTVAHLLALLEKVLS